MSSATQHYTWAEALHDRRDGRRTAVKIGVSIRLAGTVAAAVILWSCDQMTLGDSTLTAIGETYARINIYASVHGELPKSLSLLPARSGYRNRILDGWGRPLLYGIDESGIITITSLGKDGKPGGIGEDADISIRYYSRKADGSFWAGEPAWIVDGEVR